MSCNPNYGRCPQCKRGNSREAWCDPCDRKALVNKFISTGDKELDLFIQETQRTATGYSYRGYLEYVPYNRFTDVKLLAEGSFAKVFTAIWTDGKRVIKECPREGRIKGRSKQLMVALKMIDNSAKTEHGFLNELKLYYQTYQMSTTTGFCECYGITKHPKTNDYALILEYFPDGDLRKSLTSDSSSKLTWKNKLSQLRHICDDLRIIHKGGYIHRNIHSGNILIGNGDDRAHLIDFGLARPTADSARSTKAGTYGVIPYMAPELFRGEPHSKASDIYAIGIIMSEYASDEPAFYDRDHDIHLQFGIIDGLRPEVPPEATPECYKELMDWCLSGNPSDRPTAEELFDLIKKWWTDLRDNKDTNETKQFKIADGQWKPRQQPKRKHTGAVYTSRLITHVKTDTKGPISAIHDGASMLPPIDASDFEIIGTAEE